jgi:8-oxo-dGTP diphosphatase
MADGCIHVTAGIIARDDRVLVCQRAAGGWHAGKWEFPGGKVEPGESLVNCMRRELLEELGIEATIGRILWQTRHRYPDRDLIALTFFLIPQYAGAITNRVFAAIEWIPIDKLPAVDFLEADREFVAALRNGSVPLD